MADESSGITLDETPHADIVALILEGSHVPFLREEPPQKFPALLGGQFPISSAPSAVADRNPSRAGSQ
jgi:hypothetical protein